MPTMMPSCNILHALYLVLFANPNLLHFLYTGMRKFYDEGKRCGPVNYIDVYNMTAELASNPLHEAPKMTYDMVHWGIEANLHKAQIILNALLSAE